jgi:hypothetical protein
MQFALCEQCQVHQNNEWHTTDDVTSCHACLWHHYYDVVRRQAMLLHCYDVMEFRSEFWCSGNFSTIKGHSRGALISFDKIIPKQVG